jgi:hypothetical protein
MPPKVLVNLQTELEAAGLPEEHFQHDWMKRVTKLNKSVDDGFSLQGEFTKKWDCKALQIPGLYLLHDRTREIPFRSELFELLPDGKVKLIAHQEGHTKDWAVNLWEPIEQWFTQQAQIKKQLSQMTPSAAPVTDGTALPTDGAVLGGELGAKLKAMREQRQKPLFNYVVKYAIHGWSNQPYKVRTSEIDFSEVPNGNFNQYLEGIAKQFDVHSYQLPRISQQGIWTMFHVPHSGDEQ